MNRYIVSSKLISTHIIVLILFCISACAEIRVGTIPTPPPSAKLRVLIMPVSGNPPSTRGRSGWARPHEQFKKEALHGISTFLQDTGIYDVVPEEDIRAVLGTQDVQHWKWLRNDLALIKQIGKSLHADYAIISIRNAVSGWDYESKIICLNLDSGKQYINSYYVSIPSSETSREEVLSWNRKMFRIYYRKMFHDVKEDLLATAFRKGRLMPMEEIKKPASPKEKLALAQTSESPIAPSLRGAATEKKPSPTGKTLRKLSPPVSKPPGEEKTSARKPPPAPIATTQPVPESLPSKDVSISKTVIPMKPADQDAAKTVPDTKEDSVSPKIVAKISPAPSPDVSGRNKHKGFEKKLENELQSETPMTDKTRLVVYDLAAIERLNVVALILTEALREELFMLGQFTLVNREDLQQVMQELKLQQSGLVDEKQIVALGKWLAANETVTGRLAVLGNSYILQAKRTDVKTMATLRLGSLRCVAGREDELLSGMPDLARKLVGLSTTPHGNK
jgi:hypothetical protein